jgi:HAD superfamily hydrolase (TIGR01662 family)
MEEGYDYTDMVREKRPKKKRPPLYLRDSYLISYPKSGRTWVRMILASLLQSMGKNPNEMEMVIAAHWPYSKAKKKIELGKSRIVMVFRDPRDILVSYYFELTRRKRAYRKDISHFVRSRRCGILPVINYYNEWYEHCEIPEDFLVITYEDLKKDTFLEIKKVTDFLGLCDEVTDAMIKEAIEFSNFKNMKRVEAGDEKDNLLLSYHGTFGRKHKDQDPESFRVRKGKVGGYFDYLSNDDVQYLNEQMGKKLHPFFQAKLNWGVKYLFIDFDGTVRETIADPTLKNPKDRRPPYRVEEIKIIPCIGRKLKEWKEKGWFIVGVSNQSGVEKGLISEEMVKKIAEETMNQLGIHFPFYFAPHKYKGGLLHLRKPNTGMAELAFREYGPPNLVESFVVGDYTSDEKFAENLGMKYVHVDDFIANY